MTLVGAALAVLQSVVVIVGTKVRRDRLTADRVRFDSALQRKHELERELEDRWGIKLSDGNLEDKFDIAPDQEQDRLLSEYQEVKEVLTEAGWIYTWWHVANGETPKGRELRELNEDWRRMWTQGVPGLIGGVLALVGAVLLAISSS